MALANFHARSVAAAVHVLQNFDEQGFRNTLEAACVGVAFDRAAALSDSGTATLELAVDLLARLYPRLFILPLGRGVALDKCASALFAQACSINPDIELTAGVPAVRPTACIIVGGSDPALDGHKVFIGSDGWRVRLSATAPIPPGRAVNPFAAGAAACLGVANVFRLVFADQLPHGAPDGEVCFSILSQNGAYALEPPLPKTVDIGTVHLAGLGAIGRGFVWAMRRVPRISGALDLIDHENIELSNLQRYVECGQADVDAAKVDTAARLFSSTSLRVTPHQHRWGAFLGERGDWDLGTVAVALDTAQDRRAVQASLPRRIVNAWTQPGDLGVSRHDFLDGACLACLYLPERPVPHEDEVIAAALGLTDVRLVREMLHAGTPVGHTLLEQVSAVCGVELEKLLPYEGLPLRAFYGKAVCGTVIFGGAGKGDGAMAVPMAFQSALAGVLLAAEVVIHAAQLRRQAVPVATKVDLLRPFPAVLTVPAAKAPRNRCICQDADYVRAYRAKYNRQPTCA